MVLETSGRGEALCRASTGLAQVAGKAASEKPSSIINIGPVGLGATLRVSQGQSQLVLGTSPGSLLILHSGSQRLAENIYVPFVLAIPKRCSFLCRAQTTLIRTRPKITTENGVKDEKVTKPIFLS